VTFEDLRVFSTVAAERSFSKAARKLRRTQPAVSQAIRRLEHATGERLVDRSSRDGTLTDAGTLLLDYAQRLLRLADEASGAVTELRDVKKGRVLIGANEGAVHAVLPLIEAFIASIPGVLVEVRRVAARHIPQELLLRTLDFGVLTFKPAERELASQPLGTDELVLLVSPAHPLAGRGDITDGGDGAAVGDRAQRPLAARDAVLRLYEQRHAALNICMSLPSLDGIKRAVEMGLGVALLPRRCAQASWRAGSWSRSACPSCARRGRSGSCTARTPACRTPRARFSGSRRRSGVARGCPTCPTCLQVELLLSQNPAM
jgi:DNA-binding transcriptional LysR family regulator